MSHKHLGGFLQNVASLRQARSGRCSSWDQSGKNQDYWVIPPGEEVVLAELIGPGCVTHLWMTQFCRRLIGPGLIDPMPGSYVAPVFEIHNALGVNWEEPDPFYYRKVILKIFWDEQEQPSVLTPLGDFFCIGHSIPGNFSSLPITVSCKPEERHRFGGSAALNCYFPMPFQRKAKIVLENQNDVPYGQYFYLDYELYREPLAEPLAYFHTHWRRENPCRDAWAPDLQVNSPEVNVPHLDAAGNYVVLETEGTGHYVGCNLSVAHFQGSWWGEGDEMIFIDGDTWPPSLHGTGSEDYFNHAWGMQDNAFLMNGSALHESIVPGYQVSYRFHLADPIHFAQRIAVTLEHGHANHLADDWSSTAYWYQTLPSPVKSILPVDDRLPTSPLKAASPSQEAAPDIVLSPIQRAALEAARERFSRYKALREEHFGQKIERTREYSRRNIEQARVLRDRYDQQERR